MKKIPQETLEAAVKEAVAQKIFPSLHMAKWNAMECVLQAAFQAAAVDPLELIRKDGA